MSVAAQAREVETLTPSQRRLLAAIGAELARQDPSGSSTAHVEDIEAAARAAVDALVHTGAFWEEHLGPVYDAKTVAVILGSPDKPVSRQAVSKRPLLALRTGNGRVYYPAFQFANGRPIAGLAEVLAALDEHLVSRWTLASWLVSPEGDLDDVRPIDALRAGDVEHVLRVARAWAVALQ
ncbi:MAG: hypothetical protein ACR2KE_05275 [Candidatus Nanopelagicales bacterium]